MILRPLARVVARTDSRPGTRGTAGSTAAVNAPTARKCEPKFLFIAPVYRSSHLESLGELKSASVRTFVTIVQARLSTMGTRARGCKRHRSWLRSSRRRQKKGAASGGRRIAAHRSEHRGRGSLFKPYTLKLEQGACQAINPNLKQ